MQTIWPMSFFVVAWCERNIVFCYLVPCHSPKWWTPLRLQAIARRLFIRLHGISSRTCPGSSFVFLNMSCNVEDVGVQFWWYYIWFCLLLDYFWHHCNYEWKTDYLEPNNVAPRVTINTDCRIFSLDPPIPQPIFLQLAYILMWSPSALQTTKVSYAVNYGHYKHSNDCNPSTTPPLYPISSS